MNTYSDPERTAAALALHALLPAPTMMPGRNLGVVEPADLDDDEIQPPYSVEFGDALNRDIFCQKEFRSLKAARSYIERAFAGSYATVRGQLGYDGEDFEEQWPSVTHAMITDEYSEDVELLCRPELVKGVPA